MSTPTKGEADYLELGDWNAVCYDCGRKAKASTLVKTWQGFYVCPHHVDITRHPQDFVRGIPDVQTPPWSQPQPADSFVSFCTTVSGIADYAIAGCAIADNTTIPA